MNVHNQSQTVAAIAPALVKALASIADVGKGNTATIKSDKGSFTYKFATLSDVMALVRPIFAANDLAMLQFARGSEDGRRIEIETMALHVSGEWMSDSLSLPLEGAGARGAGSAITYARRYGAMAFVGMASDDDDAAAAQSAESAIEAAQWQKQVADFIAAIDGADNEQEGKDFYRQAVTLCTERSDVGAANRIKSALLKRFPTVKKAA